MSFIDRSQIFIKSGHGGRGMVNFGAAKYCPKLGADGGDGGHGGNVYLRGDRSLNTLSHLKHRQRYEAEDGARGGTNGKTGRSGADLIIKVPLGTIVFKNEEQKFFGEILEHGVDFLIAKGGKRGLGNKRFLSATHQAPEEYTPGGKGEEFLLRLELKLLADVGFAGLPNAGKSTLLSSISAARPKIADYPFTTLSPQLGVVDVDPANLLEPKSFVAADIPGLIEGAALGKGLGHDFLKHLERTKILAFILDPFTQELGVKEQFELLKQEIMDFDQGLALRPAIAVITKMDLLDTKDSLAQKKEIELFFLNQKMICLFISAVSRQGIDELKRKLFDLLVLSTIRSTKADLEVKKPSKRPRLSDYKLQPSRSNYSIPIGTLG